MRGWVQGLLFLVVGGLIIGFGGYYWAWSEQNKRERERQQNEMLVRHHVESFFVRIGFAPGIIFA